MADMADQLLYLSLDTLESIMHDLEKAWMVGAELGSTHALVKFMGDVEQAIKERARPQPEDWEENTREFQSACIPLSE